MAEIFAALRKGRALYAGEVAIFRSALLHRLALLDHARGWVQQFHVGALRNNNTRMRRLVGPDTGFDSVGDFEQGRSLARFLDRLDEGDQLAKTILYNLNPRDNELMATMVGNFQDGRVPGKMQWGSAWWFLDQLDGMEAQIRVLANMALLSRFVGMITDSRSFLSYSRHDYFRRLLCNILGEDVRRGRLPDDRKALANLVANVSFFNARDYFGFPLGQAAGEHARAPRRVQRSARRLACVGGRGLHERDRPLERVERALEQDLALRQVGPLLALRTEHEVVVAVLVDVHPHGLARLLERVVEHQVHGLQPVLAAHQDQERGPDRRDVRPRPRPGRASAPRGRDGSGPPAAACRGTRSAPARRARRRAASGTFETRNITRLPPRLTP